MVSYYHNIIYTFSTIRGTDILSDNLVAYSKMYTQSTVIPAMHSSSTMDELNKYFKQNYFPFSPT